jgi:D-3-phosphoglycerate dehydrogenase
MTEETPTRRALNPKPLGECRVLVTPTSFAKGDASLKIALEEAVGEALYNTTGRPLSSPELVQLITGIDGYIAGVDAIDREVIRAADQLRVIARYGVGVDSIDLEAARQAGIVVCNTPGANATSVAELTIGLMLSLARNFPVAFQATKAGEWPRLSGLTLEGKTIGLIGFGAIGQQVARRLSGFNSTILVYDPVVKQALPELPNAHILSHEEVIRQSDFLSLHCALTAETKAMVDAKFLAKMKPGAFLINTARGELIDEGALFDALHNGKLRGAALDVFTHQPPGKEHPLLGLPQVIASPHMGAHTDSATNAMGWMALRECLAVLRGENPLHRVV